MNCDCRHSCMKRISGDNRLCAPKDLHFTIARVVYVTLNGEVEREDEFFPQRYTTLEAALAVVCALRPGSRYVIDDTPRMGIVPAFTGWPDQAAKKLLELEQFSQTNELVSTG